ncbi:MAG TPA: hypothetical protein VIL18_04480 [Longimicrobiales bacterium]
MRSNRSWTSLAAALVIGAAAGCGERTPFDPASAHYRPQLAVVPGPIVIDFEGLVALETLEDQYADRGVVFSGAAAIDTSQLEPKFIEPRSGIGMAFNCVNLTFCGPLVVSFPDGAIAVGAHVTGFETVTLTCFDAAGTPLGSAATPGRNVKENPEGIPNNFFIEVAAPGIASCSFQSATIDRDFVIDDFTFTPAPKEVVVRVQVQQGAINLGSRGLLAVAILSDAGFDAVADVNLRTVTLGDGSAEDTPMARHRNGRYLASGEDVDGDGDRDLLMHFSTPSLVKNGDLTAATTELVVRGATKGGLAFIGSDDVRIVP